MIYNNYDNYLIKNKSKVNYLTPLRKNIMKNTLFLIIIIFSFLWGTISLAQIYSYTKITDEYTTYTIIEPDYKEGDEHITELCMIGDITYIFVPDILVLPEQPTQITLSEVIPSEALYQAIEKVSPHAQLINRRIADGLITMAEGEAQKRALGYVPIELTSNEKKLNAGRSLKASVWWQKTDGQLNTYIDNNWDDPAKRKAMFKELVKQVADIMRFKKCEIERVSK